MNTKDAVIQSYMDLVIQKNTTDVKVADICHHANISRHRKNDDQWITISSR